MTQSQCPLLCVTILATIICHVDIKRTPMQYICNQTCQPDFFVCMYVFHHVSLQHAPDQRTCQPVYVEVEIFIFYFFSVSKLGFKKNVALLC